jgi:hypothetical protein
MYILTAKIDRKNQILFNQLRSEYFPAYMNFHDAHVTLFHQYPNFNLNDPEFGTFFPEGKLSVVFEQVYFTGKGFAVEVRSPELESLRVKMHKIVDGFTVGPEESTKKLHVTIQSKVDPKKAMNAFETFTKTWVPVKGEVYGIEVWKPINGPWGFVQAYPFK